jgi:ElaB/YqjD/DUF883 family membrane-anchored ribosome-binding protein
MRERWTGSPAQGRSEDVSESISGKVADIKERAQDMKEQIANATRRAATKVDAQREPAARALENTADRLRGGIDAGISKVSRAVSTTADKLQATGDYIRQNDVWAMMDDVKDMARRHPGPALVAAAVAGFLVGRAFSRTD